MMNEIDNLELENIHRNSISDNPSKDTISARLQESIDSRILPMPKIYLVPLSLDYVRKDNVIVMNPKGKKTIECDYNYKWDTMRKHKNDRIHIKCTQTQYYDDLYYIIDYYKRRAILTNNDIFMDKNLFFRKKRLQWLSDIKERLRH